MANKRVLTRAALAFLLVSQIAHAPVMRFFPPKERSENIRAESSLEEYLKESKDNFAEMQEQYEKRLVEERRKRDELAKYITTDFRLDSEELLLARLIFGECEGCKLIEKVGIAFSPINRLDRGYGQTLKEVILAPNQYSAFNPGKDSSIYLKRPLDHGASEFMDCLQIAKDVLAGKYQDPTRGAVSYFNSNHRDLRGQIPRWARSMERIGRIKTGTNTYSFHEFYK